MTTASNLRRLITEAGEAVSPLLEPGRSAHRLLLEAAIDGKI